MKKKILFLDYDGVLFDTLREVYVVNRALYRSIDFSEPIDEIEYSKYAKFKYLIYNIWMFYYYNPLIFGDIKEELIVESFSKALKERDLKKEEEYCRKFLDIRHDLIINHYELWKNLETPYRFFKDIKELYENKNINIVIASKKNKTSIIERFSDNNFKLSSDFIFAREFLDKYSSKGEFMKEYMEQNGYSEAIFVDDNYNNIKTCENNPKIQTILALWGNSGPCAKGLNQNEAILKIKEFLNV